MFIQTIEHVNVKKTLPYSKETAMSKIISAIQADKCCTLTNVDIENGEIRFSWQKSKLDHVMVIRYLISEYSGSTTVKANCAREDGGIMFDIFGLTEKTITKWLKNL